MHLLEETTVRTKWTRAPGPVNAYEIQFIPTVRAMLQEGAEWAGPGGGGAHRMQGFPGDQWLSPDVWVPEAAVKAFLSCHTRGTEGLCSISSKHCPLLLEHP